MNTGKFIGSFADRQLLSREQQSKVLGGYNPLAPDKPGSPKPEPISPWNGGPNHGETSCNMFCQSNDDCTVLCLKCVSNPNDANHKICVRA